MAYQPSLNPGPKSNVYDEEVFRAVVTFGTTSIASVFGKDIKITRTGAGTYTVELPQTYRRVTHLSVAGVNLFPVLTSETVGTDGKLFLQFQVAAGTPTDPANNAKAFISVGVSRNVLNDRFVA